MSKPSFEKTYTSATGDDVFGDYGWVTDDAYLDDIEEPVLITEETWQRTGERTYWHVPTSLYSCTAGLGCDEDAVAWVLKDDEPVQACKAHSEGLVAL